MGETLVLLRGGSRDGETTTADDRVTRILVTSAAPGLVDIYEQSDELVPVAGNPERATVFVFSAQEPFPEHTTADSMHLHLPPSH